MDLYNIKEGFTVVK